MELTDGAAIIQTTVVVLTCIYGIREFKKWRIELLGSKKIELALRIGALARQIQSAFQNIRRPRSTTDTSLAEILKHSGESKESFQIQIGYIQDLINQLYTLDLETELLFGSDWSRTFQGFIGEYSQQQTNLAASIRLFFQHSDLVTKLTPDKMNEIRESLFPSVEVEKDEFTKKTDEITKNIIQLMKKHVK